MTLPQHCRSLKIHHRLSGRFLLFFLKPGLSFTMKSKSAGIAGVSHPYLAKHVFQVCLLMCHLTIIKLIIGIFFSRTPCEFLVPTGAGRALDPLQLEL